ncbi:hypothetical protein SAMN05444157_0361 [Frankineae bacterium MT45]|nr:hypothetical protein SAMN05444157_0361 [Frankineae bacterium MT45]
MATDLDPPGGVDQPSYLPLARSRSATFALLTGIGIAEGIAQGAISGSVAAGVVQGLAAGLACGLASMFVTGWRMRRLGRLTSRERRTVVGAFNSWTSPDDPRLARAMLEYVAMTRTDARRRMLNPSTVAVSVIGAALIVTATVSHAPLVFAIAAGVVGVWQGELQLPWREEKQERIQIAAHFAERRAREVLGLPLSDEPSAPAIAYDSHARARSFGVFVVGLLAATLVGFQVLSQVPLVLRAVQEPPSVLDADPVQAGYRRVGLASGETFWARLADPNTLLFLASGRADAACRDQLNFSPQHLLPVSPFDICRIGEHRHGTVLAWLTADSAASRARVILSDGTTRVGQDAIVDLGSVLPGARLFVFIFAKDGVTGDIEYR